MESSATAIKIERIKKNLPFLYKQLAPENYCIPRRPRFLGQTTKQPLINFEPQKAGKYK